VFVEGEVFGGQKMKPKIFRWMDASHYREFSKEFLDGRTPTELLCEQRTCGYIYKEDENAVVIVIEEQSLPIKTELSFVVIPKKWIKE
jgi:hypothetical protein